MKVDSLFQSHSIISSASLQSWPMGKIIKNANRQAKERLLLHEQLTKMIVTINPALRTTKEVRLIKSYIEPRRAVGNNSIKFQQKNLFRHHFRHLEAASQKMNRQSNEWNWAKQQDLILQLSSLSKVNSSNLENERQCGGIRYIVQITVN